MSQKSRSDEAKIFKRKRTAHACEECRSRKSRCDGGRPICDKCSEMGFLCRYALPKRFSDPSFSGTQALEDGSEDSAPWLSRRLDKMERLLKELVSGRNDTETPLYLPHSPPDTLLMQARQSSDPVDGMGCMTFADEDDAGHFGPTSNATFLHHIISAVKDLQHVNSLQPSFEHAAPISQAEWPSPNAATKKPPKGTPDTTTNSFGLPPYETTVDLLKQYFQHTGDMFPYIHQATVLSYIGPSQDQQPRLNELHPVQRCLISTCLAFASVHGSPGNDRESDMQNARGYFEVARSTLPEIMPGKADVETIQALLLVLQYSQGTQRSSETWGLMGAIVQRAFQMGLYRSSPPIGLTGLEMGVRSRTWWMVFMMDKMCSMTFGRPPLIPNSYMESVLPSNIAFGLGKSAYGLSDATATNLAGSDLFLQTCKLNLILGDVIETVHGCNIENKMPSSLLDLQQHIVRIENRLFEWKNQLPLSCRLLELSEAEDFRLPGEGLRERRTVVVLSLRYLNLRALLHRATIYRLLEPGAARQDCREFHSLHNSINICIESAVLSIKIISRVVQQRDILPIWWFSAYYTLTASLTIFAAITLLLKEPTHLQQYSIHQLLSMLQSALESLDGLEQDSLVVYRCQQALQRIIHTCWVIAGQCLPDGPPTESFDVSRPPQEHQSNDGMMLANNFPYQTPQPYPFTSTDPWVNNESDLDLSWVNALANNMQVYNGGF